MISDAPRSRAQLVRIVPPRKFLRWRDAGSDKTLRTSSNPLRPCALEHYGVRPIPDISLGVSIKRIDAFADFYW